jgi:Ca2+/Na+ antiporter
MNNASKFLFVIGFIIFFILAYQKDYQNIMILLILIFIPYLIYLVSKYLPKKIKESTKEDALEIIKWEWEKGLPKERKKDVTMIEVSPYVLSFFYKEKIMMILFFNDDCVRVINEEVLLKKKFSIIRGDDDHIFHFFWVRFKPDYWSIPYYQRNE